MLSEFYYTPILLLAFDEVNEEVTDLVTALSGSDPNLTEAEIIDAQKNLEQLSSSDVNLKSKRVRIPIVDAVGMQHVGSTTTTTKDVFYDDDNVILANSTNRVNIRLELKSAISKLSTSADLFYGVADKIFPRYTTSPRASFFSPSVCIYNGYLVGIGRQSVANTDKEVLTLSFERSDNNPTIEFIEETEINNTGFKPVVDQTADPASRRGAKESEPLPTSDLIFDWYKLDKIIDAQQRIITDYTGKKNVNRLPFVIHKSQKTDFFGVEREFLTVEYNRVFIPLGLNDKYPFYMGGLAVDLVDGFLFLGLEVVN